VDACTVHIERVMQPLLVVATQLHSSVLDLCVALRHALLYSALLLVSAAVLRGALIRPQSLRITRIASLMPVTLGAVRTVQSSRLGRVRSLTICVRGVFDAPRLSLSSMLAAIAVLHSWHALSPVGARRLEVAVRHYAGAASETTTGRAKAAATTRTMHPRSTAKPMHVALRDGPAIACKEDKPRSHRYDCSSHVVCSHGEVGFAFATP
jgi:hypothetical protein